MKRLRESLSPHRVRTWVIASAMVASGVYTIILWSLRRGFDWTDEGWAYSFMATGRVADGEVWGFQHLLHPVFGLLGESVLAFRVLRVVAYVVLALLSTVVLARVAAHLGMKLRRAEWWLVFVFAQVGTFLAWSFPPRYFAYNEVSGWFSQVGVLIVVLLLAGAVTRTPMLTPRVAFALWAAAGCTVVLLAVTKFTAGALLGVVVLAAIFVGDAVLSWGKRWVAAVSGAGLGALVLVATGFPFGSYVSSVVALLFDPVAQAEVGHPLRSLLVVYKDSVFDTSQMILVPTILFTLTVGLALFKPTRAKAEGDLLAAGAVLFAVLTVVSVVTWPQIPIHPSLGRFIFVAAAFGVISLIAVAVVRRGDRESRAARGPAGIAVAAIFAAPFIAALGTNNFIAGQTLYSATLWMTVIAIGLVVLARTLEERGGGLAMIPRAFLFILVVISALQVMGDVNKHPYRSTPYAQQNSSTGAPYLQGMLLTEEEASFASWLSDQAMGLDAKDVPAVALSMPGALLVFNNSDYAGSWLEGSWPATFRSLSVACEKDPPADFFVLQPGFVADDSQSIEVLTATLSTDCGLAFPEDFQVVAERPSRDPQFQMTIWRAVAVDERVG